MAWSTVGGLHLPRSATTFPVAAKSAVSMAASSPWHLMKVSGWVAGLMSRADLRLRTASMALLSATICFSTSN